MVTEITMADMRPESGLPPDNAMHVVMFYGATCGPCKGTMPHYESAAQFFTNLGASMKFYRINAWEPEEQKTYCSEVWQVTGVPTFKVFFKGQNVHTRVGGGDETAMLEFLQECVDIAFKMSRDII